MALVARKALIGTVSPLLQFKRFRGKINIQRPKAPHFIRAAYLELAKPWFLSPKKGKSLAELCKGAEIKKTDSEDNPLQRIIAKELYCLFTSSRLVIFFHQNVMTGEDKFKSYVAFKRQNMFFKNYGKKTLQMAIGGTPYKSVLDFYVSQNMLLFSPDANIKKVMTINKKFPQLIMLAGILDGKFISRDELVKYSMIPDIQTAQVRLMQTLNSMGTQLVTQFNTHQLSLVSNLNERFKQLQKGNE